MTVSPQVTETRTGPLGCSNYDNLDTVSSVLVHSPENKVQLQGETQDWERLGSCCCEEPWRQKRAEPAGSIQLQTSSKGDLATAARAANLWNGHAVGASGSLPETCLCSWQGCRWSCPGTCRASSSRRLSTTSAVSPRASLCARAATAGASAAWSFPSATALAPTWTPWRRACCASETPGGRSTRSLSNLVGQAFLASPFLPSFLSLPNAKRTSWQL